MSSWHLLVGLSRTAAAADPAPFEWTKDQFDLVATGESAEGKKLAKKYKCKKCHNADGISDDEEVPSIAGQRATYVTSNCMTSRRCQGSRT